MIYYKGIVGHYTIVLKFHRSLGKNGKNVLKGEYQKEGIKYEGGMILLGYSLQSSCIIFFMQSSPLVHMSK